MSVTELNQPTQNYQPEGEAVNPYLAAKAEWDNRIGSARVQAFNWRIFALASMILSVILACGLIYQSTKSTVTPYIVEVSADGAARAVGPAREATFVPQEKEIKYFLGQFIIKTRTLTMDPVVSKQNWVTAYAFMRPAAANKMNDLVKKENPLAKMGQETVQANIRVVVPVSKNTFQIRWTEDVFTKDGAVKESYRMTGLFTVDFTAPKTEQELMVNPLGLYISDFSWSREL